MRYLGWTALAVGLLLGVQRTSQASDTVRLGGPAAQSAIQGGTDNELVRGYYHGGGRYYGGGARYYGGYYGGGARYYGGYYGGGARYYGGYYGGGFYGAYRPYYYSSYYYPSYYYGSYYTPYYSSAYYYAPCAGEVAPTVTLQAQATYVAPVQQQTYSAPVQQQTYAPQVQQQQNYLNPIPRPATTNTPKMPLAPSGDGTFPYNGGPNQTVPMPPANDNPAPINAPRGIVPLDGKLVSMPRALTGGVSPVSTPSAQGWNYVANGNLSTTMTPTPTRIAYPAYGENAVPTPRKTANR